MGAWLTQLTGMNIASSSNTQVLFNDAGIANGSSGLTYNKTANTVSANTLVTNTANVTSLNVSGNADFSSGTSHLKLPVGTTAQRPTGSSGMIRMNSTTGYPEWYDSVTNTWFEIGRAHV